MIRFSFDQVSKSYGSGMNRTRAVYGASWEAHGGEVFGLLGPNGAGKTTTIRMMLDILRPDEGTIRVDGVEGGNAGAGFRRRVGYLPEERGLYRKRKVMDVLVFLGALKGLAPADTRSRAMKLLERFALAEQANKKIQTLSKGMAQKLQILSCVLHDPELIILDEPFSGLDPVNVRLVRELVAEFRANGKLVFLSTHMMPEVEALCDRILLIHGGRQLLYGPLKEIRRSHTDYDCLVDDETRTDDLACVARTVPTAHGKRLYFARGKAMSDFLLELGTRGRSVRRLEEGALPIEDIFVAMVQGDGHGTASRNEAALPTATPVRREAST